MMTESSVDLMMQASTPVKSPDVPMSVQLMGDQVKLESATVLVLVSPAYPAGKKEEEEEEEEEERTKERRKKDRKNEQDK